ncbi:unnamed protein product, partial [Ectocarpus sp. 13 AM-2016]
AWRLRPPRPPPVAVVGRVATTTSFRTRLRWRFTGRSPASCTWRRCDRPTGAGTAPFLGRRTPPASRETQRRPGPRLPPEEMLVAAAAAAAKKAKKAKKATSSPSSGTCP